MPFYFLRWELVLLYSKTSSRIVGLRSQSASVVNDWPLSISVASLTVASFRNMATLLKDVM
jgi:uncharacterized membrane protein YwaF